MPASISNQQKAIKIRKKLSKFLTKRGSSISWRRPQEVLSDGTTTPERTGMYFGFPDALHRSEIPSWTDFGGLPLMGNDQHHVLFDGLADLKEGDVLGFNRALWRISRWTPIPVSDITVAQIAGVEREQSDTPPFSY